MTKRGLTRLIIKAFKETKLIPVRSSFGDCAGEGCALTACVKYKYKQQHRAWKNCVLSNVPQKAANLYGWNHEITDAIITGWDDSSDNFFSTKQAKTAYNAAKDAAKKLGLFK